VRQKALIEQSKQYSLNNAAKGYWPQLSINGQASYQSAVTEINLPGLGVLTMNKDQYRVYAEVYQSITDPFLIKQQKELVKANAETEQQKTEVELYQLKERINQLYFGILLIDAQLQQNKILKKDIQAGIDKTNAAIANGTALKSNADNLQAELLKAGQRTIELTTGRNGYADMLSQFIGEPVITLSPLQTSNSEHPTTTINRPELKFFEAQKRSFLVQDKLITAKNIPRVGLFLQGGYGRPGLNPLSNEFSAYYIGGLKLNWNFGSLYTAKKDRALLKTNRQVIDVQQDVFLFNTKLAMTQQNSELEKYRQLIRSDEAIIGLREKVKITAQHQLTFGTISSIDYISYVNAEDQARQQLLFHQVQASLARYTLKTISGNE
jgi:outer membrane protein TolC